MEQVGELAKTSLVQRAWRDHQRPWLHGWVYDMHTGRLRELTLLTHEHQVDSIHRYDFDDDA